MNLIGLCPVLLEKPGSVSPVLLRDYLSVFLFVGFDSLSHYLSHNLPERQSLPERYLF